MISTRPGCSSFIPSLSVSHLPVYHFSNYPKGILPTLMDSENGNSYIFLKSINRVCISSNVVSIGIKVKMQRQARALLQTTRFSSFQAPARSLLVRRNALTAAFVKPQWQPKCCKSTGSGDAGFSSSPDNHYLAV